MHGIYVKTKGVTCADFFQQDKKYKRAKYYNCTWSPLLGKSIA